jgi:hypothetical protein
VALAGAVALASAVRQLKRGYKQRTPMQAAVTLVLNAVLTTSMARKLCAAFAVAVSGEHSRNAGGGFCRAQRLGSESVKMWILKRLGVRRGSYESRRHQRESERAWMQKPAGAMRPQCPF